MKVENPITFTAPCYILFNVTKHCCSMTELGHLGIFATKNIADISAKATEKYTGDKIVVLSVSVIPIDEVPL